MLGAGCLKAQYTHCHHEQLIAFGCERRYLSLRAMTSLINDDQHQPAIHADPDRWTDVVTGFEAWFETTTSSFVVQRYLYPCDGKQLQVWAGKDWRIWRKP